MKTTLYNTINSEVPKELDSFEELPEEFNYYYMETGEKFVFNNDIEMALIQTKLMSKIMYRFSKDIFMNGTFFTAPKLSYQLIVIRVYAAPLKKYFIFQLTEIESKNLWFQIETKNLTFETCGGKFNRPYTFIEEGVSMLATILHIPVAELISTKIMDAFVTIRK